MRTILLISLIAVFSASEGAFSQCPSTAPQFSEGVVKSRPPTLLLRESVGPSVPVTELDFSDLLMRRVREASRMGLFTQAQKELRERLRAHAAEPVSLELPASCQVQSHTVPMMSEADLENLEPALRGALEREKRLYVFFDASRTDQALWAARFAREHTQAPLRLVATRGDRFAFEKTYGLPLYADQGGMYVRRWGVESLPSVVTLTAREAHVRSYPIGDMP